MLQTRIVYVDMDDVLCQYSEAHATALDAKPDILFPQSVAGFYLNLQPIPGAIEAVKLLRERFDVHILTAPSSCNPLCYTEKRLWVERHFDFAMVEKLIISPNKGLLKGDVLIDDKAEGRGQDRFEGLLLQFGTSVFPNWATVMAWFAGNSLSAAKTL